MSRVNLENPRIEDPIIVNGFRMGVTVVSGTGNTTLTEDMGPIISITPTAARTLTLPAATANRRGLTFFVVNAAAFAVTVQNPVPTSVGVVPATIGATGMFVCLGDAASGGGIGGWSGGL